MKTQDAIKEFWLGYFDHSDSSPRSEFYQNVLILIVGIILLSLIYNPLGIIFAVASVIPFLALCFRRCHDAGYSNWVLLWILLPIIGLIMDIAILTAPEKIKNNSHYAPDPVWQTYVINDKP